MLPNWLYGKSKSKLAELLGGGGTPSDYSQVKAQVTQNTEDIASLDDTLDTKAALTQISNPNILHNPWFQVNQRAVATVTTSGFFIADRWQIIAGGASFSVSISNNKITINNSSGEGSIYLRQKRTNTYISSLLGMKLTASVMLDDGTIFSGTNEVAENATTLFYNDDNISIDLRSSSDVNALLVLQVKPGKSVTIKALKLELGSVSTLAMDTAPDMALELLKCQRYFYRLDIPQYQKGGIGVAQVTNSLTVTFFTPVNMIAKPSITSNGAIRLRSGSNYIAIESMITYGNNNSNRFDLQLTTAQDALTVGTLYEVYASSGASYIDFDAEL